MSIYPNPTFPGSYQTRFIFIFIILGATIVNQVTFQATTATDTIAPTAITIATMAAGPAATPAIYVNASTTIPRPISAAYLRGYVHYR